MNLSFAFFKFLVFKRKSTVKRFNFPNTNELVSIQMTRYYDRFIELNAPAIKITTVRWAFARL